MAATDLWVKSAIMANSFKEDVGRSPESSISISSLLASCSLGNSLRSSCSHISSVQYKEKLYESATEALEAYIEDYDGSLLSPAVSTGKIRIQTTPVKCFRCRHKDDMIELLILKAERALESSVQAVPSSMENIGSPKTEDIVDTERSWEKIPVTFKSPVPVCSDEGNLQTTKLNLVNDFLKDCTKKNSLVEETTLSGGNHHGPVEALKQMLFNLQTVQQSYSHDKAEKEEFKKLSETDSELELFDQEMMPVNKSLQKALHHLSRLKQLVEDRNEEKDEENVNLEKKREVTNKITIFMKYNIY
ncbi:lung adenoma susceptibility protein 2 isoform X2 [Rhinatrema bivittatum]|uniref:lung adenoma susceptibility protein 2 isoform X2 n=1 Tax=Rhinatrema bivittatum TaxID=194408 RepID=UPI00112C644B|nr:lung adenoma susceptibility protein 2 isoform X2 [Rhinatrema bivittatum]